MPLEKKILLSYRALECMNIATVSVMRQEGINDQTLDTGCLILGTG
jgi:hypothetical protein